MKPDWSDILDAVGPMSAPKQTARRVIIEALGNDFLDESLEQVIAGGPAGQHAKAVLCFLRPEHLVERVIERFETETDACEQISLSNLLENIVDTSHFEKMCAYLSSKNADYSFTACGVIERWNREGELADEMLDEAITKLDDSDEPLLREAAARLKKERDELLGQLAD